MKLSWLIRLGLLAALVLLVGWIASRTYWEQVRIPTPLQGEAATNPFYSMQRLAEALGANTERRHTLGNLPSPESVIVLSSWRWSLIEDRRLRLQEWVSAGGRLVVDYTVIDPAGDFSDWSGIARDHPSPAALEAPTRAAQAEEAAGDDSDAYCTSLAVEPIVAGQRESYRVCDVAPNSWLTSARLPSWSLDDGELQAVRVPMDRGSVTALNATVFGNRQLLEHDHAVLFVAATQLRRGDDILFLAEDGRPSLLSLIWTYGAPAVVLALVLLLAALWRSSARFGPLLAPTTTARRSIAEQLRGTGQFALRFGGGRALHAAMVRALHDAAERRIAGYGSLSSADRIVAMARAADVDAETLAETINHQGARRAAELRNAVMVLEYTRRRILEARDSHEVANAS